MQNKSKSKKLTINVSNNQSHSLRHYHSKLSYDFQNRLTKITKIEIFFINVIYNLKV